MKTRNGFSLLEKDEIRDFLLSLPVDRQVSEIQNHHTYLPDYGNFQRKPDHFRLLTIMKDYHVSHNGWSDIAQNITTFPDGTLAICRPLSTIPAGIKGHNAQGICIEHLGNFDAGQDTMTDEHKDTIIHINAVLLEKFELEPSAQSIIYHHWFHTKTCPGTAFFGGNSKEDAIQGFIPLVKAEFERLSRKTPAVPTPKNKPLGQRMVQAQALNIRTSPDAKSAKTGVVYGGTILTVYEEISGWVRISDAENRWVSARYLAPIKKGTVLADSLNVRSGPGIEYRILGTVSKGQDLVIYERHKSWCRIDPNEKWVSGQYLQTD